MIDALKAAVVMIDMQNGFIDERSPLHIQGARASIPACERVLHAARQSGMLVVHAVRSYAANGANVEPCRYDDWKDARPLSEVCDPSIGAAEPAELSPAQGDIVLVKPRFSAFHQTNLHEILRAHGVDAVVLIGTTTPNCIRSTCYDALSLGYNVAIVEDATSSRNATVQRANIEDMAHIGAFVMNSATFAESLLDAMPDTVARVQAEIKNSGRAVERTSVRT